VKKKRENIRNCMLVGRSYAVLFTVFRISNDNATDAVTRSMHTLKKRFIVDLYFTINMVVTIIKQQP